MTKNSRCYVLYVAVVVWKTDAFLNKLQHGRLHTGYEVTGLGEQHLLNVQRFQANFESAVN